MPTLGELHRDLRDPQIGPGEDLQEDLEPLRPQGGQVEPAPVDEEETGHRIGAAGEPSGEHRAGQPGGRAGHPEPHGRAEAAGVAAADVAGGRDHVRVPRRIAVEQSRQELGRMLEVAVHHDADIGVRGSQADHDRPAEATDVVRAVDHPHRDRGIDRDALHLGRGVVGAVVDEEDLGVPPRQRRSCPLHEFGDVVALVVRRHDDRDPCPQRGPLRSAAPSAPASIVPWVPMGRRTCSC